MRERGLQVDHTTIYRWVQHYAPVMLILVGTYLVAFIATALPARSASRLRPAEALRYE